MFGVRCSAFDVQRSMFDVQRSMFDVQRSMFPGSDVPRVHEFAPTFCFRLAKGPWLAVPFRHVRKPRGGSAVFRTTGRLGSSIGRAVDS